ncbi:hypothetical protein [Rheinheimera sp. F8]|uniref:hypothetical protein n=1 Tax=Rheinheimera sp. F8 TaxID=1763998 RepID=UPI000A7AC2C5|nr:hypothetical protein [Rheinheimera sp. F8]
MSEIHLEQDQIGAHSISTGMTAIARSSSAVSWNAIFAGAAAAAALSLFLVILGTGLGFTVVSPWNREGISASTLGFTAIAWLSFTQLAASGMGGYLTGRLRTRWLKVHSDEVYFRDTAHGFLTWAVASLLTAALLTSVLGSVGNGIRAGAAVIGETGSATKSVAATNARNTALMLTGGAAGTDEKNGITGSIGYFVDSMFRADNTGVAGAPQSEIPAGEVTRIFGRALLNENLPQADVRYIGQLITQRTQLSQQDAEQRVSMVFSDALASVQKAQAIALETVDEARKASAYGALWMAATLLIGAFVASLMAVFGGRQRDL